MADPQSPSPPPVETHAGRRVLRWLVLGNAVAIVLIAVLLTLILHASRQAHLQRALDAVESLARGLELNVAAELARVDLALALVAQGLQAPGARTAAQVIADVESVVPAARRLSVTTAPAGPAPTAPLTLSGPRRDAVDGRWVLPLERRVQAPGLGQRIVAELDIQSFQRLFAGLEMGGGTSIALRMDDFALVTRHAEPPLPAEPVGGRDVSPALRAALAAQPRAGSFVALAPGDAVERTLAYRRVATHPLYVIVDRPTADDLGSWQQEARLAGGLALLLVSMLVVGSMLAYRAWRRADTNLRERDRERERLRALLTAAGDGLHVLDRGGMLVEFSDSFAVLLGFTRAELAGAHVSRWEARFQREQFDRVLRGFRVGERLDFRTLYRRVDGSTVDVDVAAVGLRLDGRELFYLAARDVTERRRAVAALQASETFLDRTGRIAGVGGWELDLGRGRLQLTVQARRLLDLSQELSVSLRRALRLFAAGGRRRLADAVARARLDGMAWDLEVPVMTFQGRGLWLRCFGEPVVVDGRVIGMIGAVQDVTERRARNAELAREQQLRAELERQGREQQRMLRERGEMLDVLAHEVRQPLNNASAALQAAAAALREVGEDPARQRLDRAQNVVGQVLARIDNTLAVAALLARPGPVEHEETDIDTLVAVAVADMPAGERARVRVQRDTAARSAPMDMSLMRLALRNLLSNALKYSAPGAPVVVRLADSEAPLGLLIDVIDQGPGVEPALQERLFERGARGRTPGSSHGLGLYIVRRVMELHGGQAQLLATGPQGTTMRLLVAEAPDD